jgi:membrane-associated phospholipid phosphatase
VHSATDQRTGRARWQVLAAWAAGLTAVALVLLTYGIYRVGRVLRVDVRALDLVNQIRRHWLVVVLQNLTWAGDFLFACIFLLVVAVVVAARRDSSAPLWLGVCAVATLVATVGTGKQVIDRSRIPFAVGSFGDGGTSYPSGHTTTAVVVGGTLVLIASPALTRRGLRWAWAAMVAYSALIGVSRLYLRYHWFTDVVAGWLLGTFIVCVLALLFVRPLTPSPPAPDDASTSEPDDG